MLTRPPDKYALMSQRFKMKDIRMATGRDGEAIRSVHLQAFSENERSVIADLATQLLVTDTQPETFSLVAEDDAGSVIGHVAFSPLTLDEPADWSAYILGPLAVVPGSQGRGVGGRLVEAGMTRLRDGDTDMVFVYGDPNYYVRFGFSPELAANFQPPHKLEYPFGWQASVMGSEPASGSPWQLACVPALDDPALW